MDRMKLRRKLSGPSDQVQTVQRQQDVPARQDTQMQTMQNLPARQDAQTQTVQNLPVRQAPEAQTARYLPARQVPGARALPSGAVGTGGLDPKMEGMLLTRQPGKQHITQADIRKAINILKEYKRGKANLENRIVEDELWWQLRHWEAIRGKQRRADQEAVPEPSSAWLFNAIINKHADAMDNYPEPVVLPREQSDQESAKTLSCVLPVILEYNDFESIYSSAWWEKLKHGAGAYGIYWNTEKENGLGDIDIRELDLLKLFWEPGITDIQQSKNLFVVELEDNDTLRQQYPELEGKLGGDTIDVKQYIYDDTVDTKDKSVVVDWYYKVKAPGGQTRLHYAKFVGDTLLYASENDPQCAQTGLYDHGLYPVVLDVMFPEKGTPVGYGYVSICKDPQLYIDKLSGSIMENAMMTTKKRFFVSRSTNVNKEQFLDWNEPVVDVEGEIDDRRIKEITTQPLSDVYLSMVQMKIEEMKETAANRDVNTGGVGSGVTAAAAIAALQEAGNKVSRDMIASSYRAYTRIAKMCIELIRQFYTEERAFRVTAPNSVGQFQFASLSNAGLQDQPTGMATDGSMLFRKPVFDLKIKAQKKNPFSRMEQNETAKELYSMGFFNAGKAQEAMVALDMMDFEGIEDVREKVMQGQTLMNVAQQLMQENTMLKAAMGMAPQMGEGSAPTGQSAPGLTGGGQSLSGAVKQAQTPMTGYGERLAKRSAPSMNNLSSAATPGKR